MTTIHPRKSNPTQTLPRCCADEIISFQGIKSYQITKQLAHAGHHLAQVDGTALGAAGGHNPGLVVEGQLLFAHASVADGWEDSNDKKTPGADIKKTWLL